MTGTNGPDERLGMQAALGADRAAAPRGQLSVVTGSRMLVRAGERRGS